MKRIRRIDTLRLKNGNHIFMTPKPPFAEFSVNKYMEHLWIEGVRTIVILLTPMEEQGLGMLYKTYGFDVIYEPIQDYSTPRNLNNFDFSIGMFKNALRKHSVAVHCFGGNGRTGLFVASFLVSTGMKPIDAINAVRKKRPAAIETEAQEDFITKYNFFLKNETFLDLRKIL